MGVQLQATSFQPELTVGEIIMTLTPASTASTSRYGSDNGQSSRTLNWQDQVGKRFGQLSGGQQQRVSLVIATIHDPPLVLMDEPTTGLDPQSRRQLWARIEAMRDKGHGILLTTHSMEEAEAVCDRIAIIDHGRIITTDSPQAIIDNNRERPKSSRPPAGEKSPSKTSFIGLTGDEVRA